MKQINLNNVKIPEWIKYFGWVLVVILILGTKSCNTGADKIGTVTITVPEKKGSFIATKPSIVVITEDKIIKGDPVIKENPLNQKLLDENRILIDKYKSVNDSVKLLMFEKLNELNQFSSEFENDDILININGIARGEVQEITPSYTIKKQDIGVAVPAKTQSLRVLGGVEVGNTKTLDNLSFKGSVLLQNRKGNIISAGYDTDNKIWLGYYRSIF